ncbi:MAG: vWA domain-containing protein [Planctomycetota bacterium]
MNVSKRVCSKPRGDIKRGQFTRFSHAPRLTGRIRRGAVLPMVAILLPVLLLVMAYVIHVAYVENIHCRVQLVTDLASRSAGRSYNRTGDQAAALAAAREAATRNPINGSVVPFEMTDLEFGISDRSAVGSEYSFSPLAADHVGEPGNAVRIRTGTLAASTTSPFQPLFPTFGISAPIRPLKTATNTQGALDIAVVLDRSGSMRYASNESASGSAPASQPLGWVPGDPVAPNSRWGDTVIAMNTFLDYLDTSPQREKISLSTFATDTQTDQRLSFDLAGVRNRLDDHSDEFYGGRTAIGDAMAEGLAALVDPGRSRRWAVRVMVVMTDGWHNEGSDPESRIVELQDENVTLFTVTFSDEADQNRMRTLAQDCGGDHFHAVNAVQLQDAFRNISRRLPSLLTQ